jgi:multidrug efflux pump subunit AcrB
MAKKSVKTAKPTTKEPKDKLLPKITMWFFGRSRATAFLWLAIAVFGIASYTTLLKREGFPSVQIPLVIVNGTYAVGDAKQVDSKVASPVSAVALKQDNASKVVTQSQGNFFVTTVQYKDGTDSKVAKESLEKAIKADSNIPDDAKITVSAPYFGVTGGSNEPVDATVSVYGKDLTLEQLKDKASAVAAELNSQNLSQVASFKVSDPFENVTNPVTGEASTVQRSFDRFGERNDSKNTFYNAVIINVAAIDEPDVIQLDDEIAAALEKINSSEKFAGVQTAISASYAPTIEESLTELQKVLLEGLLAVLVVGSLIIAIRASAIIVISMITVILATLGLLFVLGYTLNVITLFALILGLSLIVDDTIIMTEAIDAARRRNKSAGAAIRQATRKVSRAMVAATLTAALSFAPLLFIGGILGSFIRAIPITIISALLISLFVALVFIPLFSKYLLLGKKQMGEGSVVEVAAGIESKIAQFIAKPMLWAKGRRLREVAVGLTAIAISFGFIFGGGAIFKNVAFNIFPPTKDTNQMAVSLAFPQGTTTEQAQKIASEIDARTSNIIGANLVKASYYGMANSDTAILYIDLIPYDKRDITAPQLVDKVVAELRDYSAAKVDSYTLDVGPPGAGFTVNIAADNRDAAIALAKDMAEWFKTVELTRANGEVAKVTDAVVGNTTSFERADNEPIVKVTAQFDGTDVSALTILAQDAVEKEYTASKLANFDLPKDAISFDLGQESENQESFASLAIAFPILLLAIYILLAVQFRSMLQPLIIFMALPFSFFGIALGLYLTDNSFSFFAMLGFFALIGLSIKNTILLTDYANQARVNGMGPVDAAVEALSERFRPLIATSLTAVVSLIPLAITSPFWEGLAIVLIGGLISSTFLVITVFPYYYLGAEYLRWKSARLWRKLRRK